MTAFAILAGGGAVSWLLRIAFIDLLPSGRLPSWAQRALEGVGPAAMAALIATDLTGRFRGAEAGPGISLAAVLVAAIVAWKSRRPTLTVAVGIASYWLIQTMTTG
jgi:branched-subunit amino acid transport protein